MIDEMFCKILSIIENFINWLSRAAKLVFSVVVCCNCHCSSALISCSFHLGEPVGHLLRRGCPRAVLLHAVLIVYVPLPFGVYTVDLE